MKIKFFDVDKEFLELVNFLNKKERFLKIDREIEIEVKDISKARAIINLLFRLLKIYEDFKRNLSKL